MDPVFYYDDVFELKYTVLPHPFYVMNCNRRVPGYKETDPDVHFADNYSDNWVSIPALPVNIVN